MNLRDRLSNWWWRLFLSDWTSLRQDRAFRRFERALRSPVSVAHVAELEARVAEGLGVVRLRNALVERHPSMAIPDSPGNRHPSREVSLEDLHGEPDCQEGCQRHRTCRGEAP